MLFEKMKNMNNSPIVSQPITTAIHSLLFLVITNKFATQGWALRKRKPSTPIDKDVKAFIKSIFRRGEDIWYVL